MNFGPLTPQELDQLAQYLQKDSIPFEIHFNEDDAKEELQDSPHNTVSLSQFRTRAYLAQHYYIEIPDEFLINNPQIKKHIMKMLTNHDINDFEPLVEDEVINLEAERAYKRKTETNQNLKKIFALLFLAGIFWSIFKSF